MAMSISFTKKVKVLNKCGLLEMHPLSLLGEPYEKCLLILTLICVHGLIMIVFNVSEDLESVRHHNWLCWHSI